MKEDDDEMHVSRVPGVPGSEHGDLRENRIEVRRTESLKIQAVFISALAAFGAYVGLAMRDVSLWWLWPLLLYVYWAQFWLFTVPGRKR